MRKRINDHLSEILTLLLLFVWFLANSQVTIDKQLAIKLDYMAWKARQLDTTTIKLIDKNTSLMQLINELDTLNNALERERKDLVQIVASLQITNKKLEKREQDLYNVFIHCTDERDALQRKYDKQEVKLAKVISTRDTYMFANIGLGLLIVAGIVILASG